jgi:hypothetical protein
MVGTTPKAVMAGLDPAIHASLLAVSLLIAGCVSFRPTDLALVSVKATDSYDLEFAEYERARTSTKTVKTKINGIDRELTWFQIAEEIGRPIVKPGHRLQLQIDFSTSADLWEISRNDSLGASVYPCGQTRDAAIIPADALYQANIRVAPFNASHGSRNDGVFSFSINASFGNPVLINGVDQGWKYDFRARPEDVCFELAGGNTGFGYRSNTVRVSAELIAAALRDLPPYFRQ